MLSLTSINKKKHKAMKISCYFCSYRAAILLLMYVCSAVCFDGVLVKREERRTLVSTEYGQISAARVSDHTIDGSHLLYFFTLDPNSLFLPVILHADMVFYVHTGSGRLRWREEDEVKSTDLRRGDVHRLEEGSIFLIQSNLDTESERQKLRIHAIFPNSYENVPYSGIRDMLLGFDNRVLQAAFKVPAEEIEELVNGAKPPAIIHGLSTAKNRVWEMEARFVERLVGSAASNIFELNKKKRKGGTKLYNLFNEDKDFENCNGWSTTVTRKKLHALKGTNVGLFMVNLTQGSMMGPHWNPTATEIAVVLQGRGMVRVVCPGISNETGCREMRYEVQEGDTFVVPRFHAMAQMAFNNDTLVFVGFATSAKKNHPQYLAGKASVLRTLDKDVLAIAFNVTNTTMDQLVNSQQDSVILGCVSCAEEELKIVEEEIERERAAEREREAEEARKREEEKRREEEEKRKREEEERERQEEARKKEEEKRKREEEEAKREEEERERQEEEEEARKKKEEKRREEEEKQKREEEEAKREEEERERQEEEEAARRAEEERRREEEEAREKEEEAARRAEEERKKEEEEAREREEEEERETQAEREEEAARRGEEERRREEEEAREGEEEEERKKQAEREEEAARRAEEEEEEEEERKRQEEAAAARREEEKERKAEAEEEEEAAQREEEERRKREEEEEAAEGGRSEGERAEEEARE